MEGKISEGLPPLRKVKVDDYVLLKTLGTGRE
jgi:hypothetical protein